MEKINNGDRGLVVRERINKLIDKCEGNSTLIGDIKKLNTEKKSSIVDAINEVNGKIGTCVISQRVVVLKEEIKPDVMIREKLLEGEELAIVRVLAKGEKDLYKDVTAQLEIRYGVGIVEIENNGREIVPENSLIVIR
ncbi:MAG: hypothetical protein MJZ27_09900 [Bacteroidales bacterium]|nr:hypothetical protein [Bacteroidales bacterium]